MAPFNGGRFALVLFGIALVLAFAYTYATNMPGQNPPMRVDDSGQLSDFGREFATARASGAQTFPFNGKIYSTRLAGEKAEVQTASLSKEDETIQPASSNRCVIVIDGEGQTFRHELAHCNGWTHPSDKEYYTGEKEFLWYEPPAKWVHDFDGQLVVIESGGKNKFAHKKAQMGAIFKSSKKSMTDLCDVGMPVGGCSIVNGGDDILARM